MANFNHNMHGHGMSGHSGPPDPKNIVVYEVALKGKKQIAKGTYSFVFEKPKDLKFKAGQHIRMSLINPSETDLEGNSRFFSIASTPNDIDLVFAMRMRNTAFKRVLGQMKTGDRVTIQMRLDNLHESFTLHEDASRPAVFIIGGIGIVPAFSMIKDALERKLPYKMFLFYSNRRPEDAPFLDELQALTKQNPSFKLVATMTDSEKSAKAWRGETGKIDQTLLKKYIDKLEHSIYYVAGLPEMVSAMRTMLTDSGVNQVNIHAEEFTGFNLNELHRAPSHIKKSHVALVAIAVGVIAMIVVHAGAATSIFHGLSSLSLTNPASYLTLGFILVVIAVKLKLVAMGFRHGKKKNI